MNYYNERNGHVDNGAKVTNLKCPNCSSTYFVETVSREYCPDCGLECDYWGAGPNEVYNRMTEHRYLKERFHEN
jgi:uncharacterized Zn finger protein (UPF0148 family)